MRIDFLWRPVDWSFFIVNKKRRCAHSFCCCMKFIETWVSFEPCINIDGGETAQLDLLREFVR